MDKNSMYFDGKNKESMLQFISSLCSMSYDKETRLYNDIHIIPADCGAFIVEWIQAPWDNSYGGSFKYVDEDQEVCTEVHLPDDTFEYIPSYNADSYLKDWLDENPGWKQNEFGHWYKEDEAQKSKDKLNQWLDENADWHEDEDGNWKKSDDKVTPGPIYVPFSKLKEYMADEDDKGHWVNENNDREDYKVWVKKNFGDIDSEK